MRTTIELSDAHRARLLDLAARRGQKGFSELIGEAVEEYLARLGEREEVRRNALALRGTLSADAAEELRQVTAKFRKSWR
jgi:predicted transcriptional regulator